MRNRQRKNSGNRIGLFPYTFAGVAPTPDGYSYSLLDWPTLIGYPSQRVVRYEFYASGRTKGVKRDELHWYVSDLGYAAHGAVSSAAYGKTATAAAVLSETTGYNARLYPVTQDVRKGTDQVFVRIPSHENRHSELKKIIVPRCTRLCIPS